MAVIDGVDLVSVFHQETLVRKELVQYWVWHCFFILGFIHSAEIVICGRNEYMALKSLRIQIRSVLCLCLH